jgi:hypothetical protein
MFCRSVLADVDVSLFPEQYSPARLQFLALLKTLNLPQELRSFTCPGIGPSGEALWTDSVWLGKPTAKQVLVLISGTHGIEGLTGSAIQFDFITLLAQQKIQLTENTAVLLIHALTPWGYAWLRRCDEAGIDLNRNAVDFSQTLPDNPGYKKLRSLFFTDDVGLRQAVLKKYTEQNGRVATEQAISGGQYIDPTGPFYGGQAPANGRLVTETLIKDYALTQRRLAVIDLHTGLGPYGYGEIICDHQPDSAGAQLAHTWYGNAVSLPYQGNSFSVPKLGLMDFLWHAQMQENSCFVTLEFGTFSTEQLFEILLRDHQLWAKADNLEERQAHSLIMRKHFCPSEAAWKEMVLLRARQVILQGLLGVGL